MGALCALLIAPLSGCVTEYIGESPMSADLEATLNKRVALARQYIGIGDWENAKRNPVSYTHLTLPTNGCV